MEVDGDILRALRDEGRGEFPERARESALREPEVEGGQESSGVTVRGPSPAARAGVSPEERSEAGRRTRTARSRRTLGERA